MQDAVHRRDRTQVAALVQQCDVHAGRCLVHQALVVSGRRVLLGARHPSTHGAGAAPCVTALGALLHSGGGSGMTGARPTAWHAALAPTTWMGSSMATSTSPSTTCSRGSVALPLASSPAARRVPPAPRSPCGPMASPRLKASDLSLQLRDPLLLAVLRRAAHGLRQRLDHRSRRSRHRTGGPLSSSTGNSGPGELNVPRKLDAEGSGCGSTR